MRVRLNNAKSLRVKDRRTGRNWIFYSERDFYDVPDSFGNQLLLFQKGKLFEMVGRAVGSTSSLSQTDLNNSLNPEGLDDFRSKSTMKILFKYPTRQRPGLFKQTLDLYYKRMSGKHPFEFIITMDLDDETMNSDDIKTYLNAKPNLRYFYGNSKTKVEAVNKDLEKTEFDILVVISDDMIPVVNKYDDIIVAMMEKHFPKLDGALHFNDGTQKKGMATLPIMGAALYKHFGYVYHPSYVSFRCDMEFTEVIQKMNKIVYFPQVIIRHLWVGYTGRDKLNQKNQEAWNKDWETYEKRKTKGFPRE